MIYLAHAYVDRLVYRELVKKLDTLPSSPSKDMLTTLTKYYALNNIYENREWYLENGTSKAVKPRR
jgi:hypothetical protein